jgi:hypothetical protein
MKKWMPTWLETGDHMDVEQFIHAREAMPDLKRGELLNGRVYLQPPYPSDVEFLRFFPDGDPKTYKPVWMENGDRLNSLEFKHAWAANPWFEFAELLQGQVYVNSTTRENFHTRQLNFAAELLTDFAKGIRGVEVHRLHSFLLDENNVPQADLAVRTIRSDRPEFILEIVSNQAARELHEKLEVYQVFRIPEYIVWQTEDNQLNCYRLNGSDYDSIQSDDGIFRSHVLPGLHLDVNAILSQHILASFHAMNEGKSSPEHVAFVEQLNDVLKQS